MIILKCHWQCRCMGVNEEVYQNSTVSFTTETSTVNRAGSLFKPYNEENITLEYTGIKVDMYNETEFNVTTIKNVVGNSRSHVTESQNQRKKELPLAIIIAGPAAACGICIFLCIAYYFHNLQLNNRAKRLSFTLYVSPDASFEEAKSVNACAARAQKLVPASPSLGISRDDIFSQKRKSTLSVPTLAVPPALQHKRGSSWSAFADQEILTLAAPRRHSTFII